jgi:hypothetical protein
MERSDHPEGSVLVPRPPVVLLLDASGLLEEPFEQKMRVLENDKTAVVRSTGCHGEQTLCELELQMRAAVRKGSVLQMVKSKKRKRVNLLFRVGLLVDVRPGSRRLNIVASMRTDGKGEVAIAQGQSVRRHGGRRKTHIASKLTISSFVPQSSSNAATTSGSLCVSGISRERYGLERDIQSRFPHPFFM